MALKKLTLLTIITILSNFSIAFAQDLLVTKSLDSINCKIEGTKGSFTIYKIIENGGLTTKAINADNILIVKYNYYAYKIENWDQAKNPKSNKLRTSFNIGVDYTQLYKFTNPIGVDEFDEYMEDLITAYSLHLEIQQTISKRFGLAFRYDLFSSNAIENEMPVKINNTTYYIQFKDDLTMHTFSPSLLFRTPVVNKFYHITVLTGLDYTIYKNPFRIDVDNYETSAKNFGFSIGLINEFTLNENFGLAINARYRNAIIDKVDFYSNGSTNEVELNGLEKINISRYSIGLSLMIH